MNTTRFRLSLVGVLVCLTLAGCAGTLFQTPPPLPTSTYTPTPLSTPLPTVPTQVPFGLEDSRPYRVVIVPPADSDATETDLETLLNETFAPLVFRVELVSSPADALAVLCGESPAAIWVDGWSMLEAQARGCGTAVLKIGRGRGNNATTGIRSDLVISPRSRVTAISGFRDRDYCRLNAQDLETWILPVMIMRNSQGFDPLQDFGNVREVASIEDILREVAFNRCVGAIPAGTLANYDIDGIADITNAVSTDLGTSPELPYGGFVISGKMPVETAEKLTELFADDLDILEGLVEADRLIPVTSGEFDEMIDFVRVGAPSSFRTQIR